MRIIPQSREEWPRTILFVVTVPLLSLVVVHHMAVRAYQWHCQTDAALQAAQGGIFMLLELGFALATLVVSCVFLWVRPRLAGLGFLILGASVVLFLLTPVVVH